MQLGWKDLVTGPNGSRSFVLAGGVGLHAVNIFIVTTILPSVVQDLGGLEYYAWNTTLFVVASIVGSAASTAIFSRWGARDAYLLAGAIFALASFICGIAPSMPALLIGRFFQGLGGGMLVALSYAMIRHLFVPELWPRAISLVSGMWGAAALTGPFLGGIFGELGMWRWAFFALVPVAAIFALAGRYVLGGVAARTTSSGIPGLRLLVLALAVLSVSAGSLYASPAVGAAGVLGAFAGMALLARMDADSPHRLLPSAALQPTSRLGSTYLVMALLVTATTTIIFVPYLLQTMHGMSPLAAGYLTVIEALGWTCAALATGAAGHKLATHVVNAGPMVMLAGMLGLFWSIPSGSLLSSAVSLALVGAGIGMGWAHLASKVFGLAPHDERDLAASSVSTVQLIATAFGSAFAGMVANLAGLTVFGFEAAAARWLFGSFAVAPLAAGLLVWAVLTQPEPTPPTERPPLSQA